MSVNLSDLSNLVRALEVTVTNVADTMQLKQATEFLDQCRSQPNYCLALMMIVNQPDQSLPLRQAALVQLKMCITINWTNKKKQDVYVISPEEKVKIKASILDALILTVDHPKLSVIYENIIHKVMEHEREEWQHFYGMILQKLKTANSFNEFHGSLLALRQINRNFHMFLDQERKPLEEIVPSCFPLLELYMVKLLGNYNDQTAHTLNVMLHIYYEANHLVLTAYIRDNQDNLHKWMDFLSQIIKMPLSPELISPLDHHDDIVRRSKNIHLKNKKLAGKILVRFTQKHANKRFDDKSAFPDVFEQKYVVGFLQMQLESLFLLEKKEFVSPKVVHYALKYIYFAMDYASAMSALQPVMDRLLFGVVFRLTFLTRHDEQIWKEDPEEYVRKEEDVTQITTDNKNLALDLLEKLCKNKNSDCLVKVLKYFHTVCTQNIDPYDNTVPNIIVKEAVLRAMGSLRDLIVNVKEFDVEDILVKYLIPEFQSPVGFSRATACWVFGKYSGAGTGLDFKNSQSIQLGVQGVTTCLKDAELPVRVKAAVSLTSLLDHKEAEDMLRPHLQTILECYIKLMDNIDNEGVVAALEAVVSVYHDEIVPYSYQLINHLVNAFQKLCQKQQEKAAIDDEDEFDDGESELTAAGCLEAIRRILLSPLPDHTYQKVEALLIPVFNYTLSAEGCDYIEEGLGCLNLILYNQQSISPALWFYYPLMIYILVGLPANHNVTQLCLEKGLSEEQTRCLEECADAWGTDHLEMMLGCLKNYVQKGGPGFFQNTDLFGQTFYSLLDQAVQRIYTIGGNSDSDYDMLVATTLYIAVLENYPPGQLDPIVPSIVSVAYQQGILSPKTKKLSALCIQVIAMALHHNFQLTADLLISQNLLHNYLQSWFKHLACFNKDFDKMRMLYGLVSLLKVDQNKLPSDVAQSMPTMVKELVKLTTEILALREEDESEASEAQEMNELEQENQIQRTLNKLDRYNKLGRDPKDEDNDSDFDMEDFHEEQANQYYNSPLEEKDEILFFQEVLQALANGNPSYSGFLLSQLTPPEQEQLKKNFHEAQVQYDLYLKNKQEENQKRAAQNQVQVL